jgi:hypothetical protein
MVNKCEKCKKPFQANRTIDKYCTECRGLVELERERARSARRREKQKEQNPMTWKVERYCEECKAGFMPIQETQILCRNPECRKVHQRKLSAIRAKRGLFKAFRCPICEEWVHPTRRGLRTCGKESCVLEWRNQTARNYAQGKRDGTIGSMNAYGEYNMPCPFDGMQTGVKDVDSWGSSIMTPLT